MYWYWFSSFIYVYINFQPCLGSAACAGKGYGPCTTTVFCCRCDRHPKAGSKHRGPKWHFSAQISKASTGCGRQNAGVWLRNFCLLHILRGTYTNFITSDRLWKLPILRCHTPKFGFGPLFCFGPTFLFVGKTPCCIIYALNGVIWWNRGRWEAVKCISTQHLCPGCMNRVFLLRSCFKLPFFGCSVLTHWRHQLMPQVQLHFLSWTYYRQRQMETWNCWSQLLDHVGTFGFLRGSCILQNSSMYLDM